MRRTVKLEVLDWKIDILAARAISPVIASEYCSYLFFVINSSYSGHPAVNSRGRGWLG
jgi:cation diffusion facilitator CzcD-associated flavoprotein CzcO